tara:strand:- start:4804 stop:5748 length:945 start_codon:yes stop_codon:yes gene_type:complete
MPPDDNDYTKIKNSSAIISVKEIQPSSLETVDFAFYDFMNEKMNLRTHTNKGWKEVPIVWATPERAFLSKHKGDPPLFDLDGTVIYPIITIERMSVTKDTKRKGAYWGASSNLVDPLRGGQITLARKIKNDKTNNYAIADNIKEWLDISGSDAGGVGNITTRTPGRQAYYPIKDNKKVVYETITMPIPVYLSMKYTVTLTTEYAQQMNELLSPFATLGGHINSFSIKRDGHRFETFLQGDFGTTSNVSDIGNDERKFEAKLNFEVLGYVIGEAPNGERPKLVKRQNAVEVKIPRERVILGDIPDSIDNRGFYRD